LSYGSKPLRLYLKTTQFFRKLI